MTDRKSRRIPQRATGGSGRFPPLSTSLGVFVKDGSDHEFRKLVYDLTRLSHLMLCNRKHFGAYIGVSDAQALMMTIIAETEDATVGHIAQQLEVSSQFVTTEVAHLVTKGIVAKRPNEADRRSTLLSLTPKGRDLLHKQAPLRRKTNDTMFRSLTMEQAAILQEIVSNLIADGRIALHELEAPQPRSGTAARRPQ